MTISARLMATLHLYRSLEAFRSYAMASAQVECPGGYHQNDGLPCPFCGACA